MIRSERAKRAHSLYACFKHHINDCAVVTNLGSLRKVSAQRGWLKHECTRAHPGWSCDSASQETRYSSICFAHKNSRHKAPKTESPIYLDEAHMGNLKSQMLLFVISRPPLVSTFVNLHLVPHTSKTLSLVWKCWPCQWATRCSVRT